VHECWVPIGKGGRGALGTHIKLAHSKILAKLTHRGPGGRTQSERTHRHRQKRIQRQIKTQNVAGDAVSLNPEGALEVSAE